MFGMEFISHVTRSIVTGIESIIMLQPSKRKASSSKVETLEYSSQLSVVSTLPHRTMSFDRSKARRLSNSTLLTPELCQRIVEVIKGEQILVDRTLQRHYRIEFTTNACNKVVALRLALQGEISRLENEFTMLPYRDTFEQILEIEKQRADLMDGLKIMAKQEERDVEEYDVLKSAQQKRCEELGHNCPLFLNYRLLDEEHRSDDVNESLPFDENLMQALSVDIVEPTTESDCEYRTSPGEVFETEVSANEIFSCRVCPTSGLTYANAYSKEHAAIAFDYLVGRVYHFDRAGGDMEELLVSETGSACESEAATEPEQYRAALQQMREDESGSRACLDQAMEDCEVAFQHARRLGLLVNRLGEVVFALPEEDSAEPDITLKYQKRSHPERIELWKSGLPSNAAQQESVQATVKPEDADEWEAPVVEYWDSISMISDPDQELAKTYWLHETSLAAYRNIGTLGDSSPVAHVSE